MRRLLTTLDVDYLQWRALTRALVQIDFTPLRRALHGADGLVAAAKTVIGLGITFVMMMLFGGLPAFVIWTNPDLWMGGTVLSAQVGSFTAFVLLVNHAGALVSPQDHGILGFRPVTSRTYLAVRIATLLATIGPLVAPMAVLPVLAVLLRADASAPLVIAVIGVVAATVVGTTLMLIAVYGWLMVLAGPRRVAALISYAQIGLGLLAFGSFMLVGDDGLRLYMQTSPLPRAGWILLLPPVWVGSYFELAAGAFGLLEIIAAGWSLAAVLALGRLMGRRLSLEYAATIARMAETSARPATRSVWVPRVFRDETRATAILVRSQFRNDLKFRLGVLGIIPMTLVYFVIGWRIDDLPVDPFLGRDGGSHSFFIQMALFFMPDTLRQSMVQSDAYRASWIFHATPADHSRLVTASLVVIGGLFIAPYIVVLATVFLVLFDHAGHAIVHALVLGSMSYLVLQLSVLADPKLPFSVPAVPQAGVAAFGGVRIAIMLGGMFVYLLTTTIAYRSGLLVAALFVAMAAASLAIRRATAARVDAGVGDAGL